MEGCSRKQTKPVLWLELRKKIDLCNVFDFKVLSGSSQTVFATYVSILDNFRLTITLRGFWMFLGLTILKEKIKNEL